MLEFILDHRRVQIERTMSCTISTYKGNTKLQKLSVIVEYDIFGEGNCFSLVAESTGVYEFQASLPAVKLITKSVQP